MKLTTILVSAIAAATASAWEVDFHYANGQVIYAHGTRDTGCNELRLKNVKMSKFVFKPATDWYVDPTRIRVYLDNDCKQLSVDTDEGEFDLKPDRIIRAYRVD
ncbi:hypothetical protein H2201_001502 [Coniosporium apollinis]|uniref:Uncharacterized protein n=2 Tax=Coniosporium TaxID=2810619 RepID=A0ABQ9P1I9_9PEZI|nr:hypothetical protein H2199_001099 [Cladosporium sp. JES 115]KAJ9668454.1 hypothetical protein H2201_001502 [Coniosporium apollinis]